jgi:hypothetical protein
MDHKLSQLPSPIKTVAIELSSSKYIKPLSRNTFSAFSLKPHTLHFPEKSKFCFSHVELVGGGAEGVLVLRIISFFPMGLLFRRIWPVLRWGVL